MSNRYLDWFRQAEADLRHARHSLEHEMRFGKRRRFLNSVVIKSIDREQIQAAVTAFAEYLRKQHPEIERVIWFGSWITYTNEEFMRLRRSSPGWYEAILSGLEI